MRTNLSFFSPCGGSTSLLEINPALCQRHAFVKDQPTHWVANALNQRRQNAADWSKNRTLSARDTPGLCGLFYSIQEN
jgi:hypothetical protein